MLVLLLWIFSQISLVHAEVDPESYFWKQELIRGILKNGISACTRTHELVTRYKGFTEQGVKASKNQYRNTAEQAEKKIQHFKVAGEHYVIAGKHYQEALKLLVKAKNMYETAKASATRSQDEQLTTYRNLTYNQIKIADKTYKKALHSILEGNRAFNQGIRYFNSGADAYELETKEPLPKRYKYHRWPIEKLQ